MVELKSIDSKYTLVIFWVSWCPHCTNLLPELHEFYLDKKGQLEMISISGLMDKINAER
ncbi:MAG: redoxin domain-containing protein [Bacteroidetes bacterium]|nr:redoxin domain-containing protein [Bacteroidota bacterium]